MAPLVHLLLVGAALAGLYALARRFPWLAVFTYGGLPVLLTPLWIAANTGGLFKWVKLYSVLLAVLWFLVFRYTHLRTKPWARFLVALFLAGNIAEACLEDLTRMAGPNVLNALAGIGLVVTLPGWREIRVDGNRDLVWPSLTPGWISAYTVWNWVFVYLNYPEHAAYHVVVLGVPLLVGAGTWLQARAFTLGAWMMYLFTFAPFIDSLILWLPRSPGLIWGAALVSLAVSAGYAVMYPRGELGQR